MSSELETNIVSVERVKEYSEAPNEVKKKLEHCVKGLATAQAFREFCPFFSVMPLCAAGPESLRRIGMVIDFEPF